MTVDRKGKLIQFPLNDEIKRLVLESQGKRFISEALPPIIGFISENYSADIAGMKIGDEITTVNNRPINYWQELVAEIQNNKDKDLAITAKRNGNLIQLTVSVPDSVIIGVAPNVTIARKAIITKKYGIISSIPKGLEQTIDILVKQVRQFKLVFNKDVQGYKHMKGPIGIVTVMSPTWDWHFVWNFMAMFSVWLAFLNLLPIPALDGGHIVFLLYEMISGKAPSEKVLENAQVIGFIIVMSLMFLVFGSDIYHAIFD